MAGNGEVVIVVVGQDQSGAVFEAVSANLARVQARAQAADRSIVRAGEHAVPAMAAASASVRVLDGDFSHLLRAEERFLSTLPGVAKLMQAAFPVIGIVAVTEGLFKMGKGFYDAEQKAAKMAETLRVAFGDANLAVTKSNDELRAMNDRLEMSIAKLEGKPGNGLVLALDEAKVSADKLADSLIKDNDKLAELMKQNSLNWFQALFTNQRSTGPAEEIGTRYRNQSRDILLEGQNRVSAETDPKKAQGIRDETAARVKALGDRTKAEIEVLENARATKQRLYDAEVKAYGETYTKLVLTAPPSSSALDNGLKGLESAISQQQNSVKLTLDNEGLQKEEEVAKAAKAAAEARKTAAREAEEERRKQEEYLKRVQGLGIGGSQQAEYTRQAQLAKLYDEGNKQQGETVDPIIERLGKSWEEEAAAAVKSSKEQIAAVRETMDERLRAADGGYKDAEQDSSFGVKTGAMNENQRADALRRAAAESLQIKEQELAAKIALDSIDPDSAEKVAKDNAEILAAKQEYSRRLVSISEQQYEAQRKQADGYVRGIVDPLLTGTGTVSDRFKKMADDIVASLERIAANKAIEQIADGLLGGTGGRPGRGPAGATPPFVGGGIGASVGGILESLFGKKGGGKSSNGGLATGAGTLADSITGGLQQGNAGAGAGVTVNIVNQGTPQTAVSSGSSGGSGGEQQIISVIMKDADSLGPITKALGGAIGMLA